MSLCVQLPGYDEVKSFQLLRICNDLLSTQAIPVDRLTTIINEDFLSTNFLNDVLNILDNLEPTEKNLTSRQSFLLRFLNVIENGSEVQLFLYDKIFQPAEPLPFTTAVILHILSAEVMESDNIFLLLVQSPTDAFAKSRRLEAINSRLKMHDPNSQMITLCCDIIQQNFFNEVDFQVLSRLFHTASQAIRGTMPEPLQRLCSVALLKQFVQEFWESAGLDKPTVQQIGLNFMLTDDTKTLMDDLNNTMELNHPQIHSLKVYFLKNLRSRGFTIDDLKKFCIVQKGLLPWLADLPWDYVNQEASRIPFNPYGLVQEYGDAGKAYAAMTRVLERDQLDAIVKNALKAESLNSRIALIGIIVNHLYGIRASREMTHNENEAAKFLQDQIDKNEFSASYKHLALNLITNNHALLAVRQQTDNAEFIMRLVLVHIIAVHASLPAESSPLTLYLQGLQVVRDHFILTCPSDEETMIINALIDAGSAISRYQCKCGYKYFVADCGNVVMALRCPDCAADLGGHQYGVPAAGQQRLDDKPILHNVGNKDKPGYIVEDVMEDARRNVRALTSAAYRILHLFVHALIGVSAPSPNVNAFLNANGNPINDPIAYCRNHITNDWAILKTLLACDDETLALIIHSILYSIMADKPNMDAHIKTAEARDEWEQYFRDKYVTPTIKNVAATAMDIRTKMERAELEEKQKAALLETEINETLLLTDEYSKNHLPRLWRKVVDVNRESFAAYFANKEQYKAAFPFINVFFKYEEKLSLVRHLWPIVKFTQTLTSRLTYCLTRRKAQQITFRDFITSEEQNGAHRDV
ncbi:8167_t:CDS:2, partial [Paraglomus occultum]